MERWRPSCSFSTAPRPLPPTARACASEAEGKRRNLGGVLQTKYSPLLVFRRESDFFKPSHDRLLKGAARDHCCSLSARNPKVPNLIFARMSHQEFVHQGRWGCPGLPLPKALLGGEGSLKTWLRSLALAQGVRGDAWTCPESL